MKLLGVTGGIGMGKSAAADILSAKGCSVIDTDSIARDLVALGTLALQEIQDAFGSDYVTEQGGLKRRELANLVFSDATARARLEHILHPKIREIWIETVSGWRAGGVSVGVVVIPLLFETGAQNEFDLTIAVGCALPTQNARLMARGWSLPEIQRRNAAQLSADEKALRSDFVVWTEGSLGAHEKQLDRILQIAA